MEISFDWVIPVLRIFDIGKADEFYQGFLGFSVDWDHRFDPNAPLYRQISRGDLILHLSEHQSRSTAPRDDERRPRLSHRDSLERLSLYAPRARNHAMGNA